MNVRSWVSCWIPPCCVVFLLFLGDLKALNSTQLLYLLNQTILLDVTWYASWDRNKSSLTDHHFLFSRLSQSLLFLGMLACVLLFTYQSIFLVLVIGGRDYITPVEGNVYLVWKRYKLPTWVIIKTTYHPFYGKRTWENPLNLGQTGLPKTFFSQGYCENWCIQGPFLGFRWSKDDGKTWNEPREVLKGDLVGKMGEAKRILLGMLRWIWSCFLMIGKHEVQCCKDCCTTLLTC